MKFPGISSQVGQHPLYDASGTALSTGSTLVLERSMSRSYLYLQNNGANALWFQFGAARAVATITNGVVTAITVTNPGQGFSAAPTIQIEGGGNAGNTLFTGIAQPEAPAPAAPYGKPATAHCVMTGTAPNMSIASIVVDNGGSGYVVAPYCHIQVRHFDPRGVAVAALNTGLYIPTGGFHEWNGATCPTDQFSVIAATGSTAFTCLYMT